MKIEEGKYYKTQDGRKVGPMERWCNAVEYKWAASDYDDDLGYELWNDEGAAESGDCRTILSEWPSESPVRTVTKREIVPGVYGSVIVTNHGSYSCAGMYDALELRAAAATLIEIADALEDE